MGIASNKILGLLLYGPGTGRLILPKLLPKIADHDAYYFWCRDICDVGWRVGKNIRAIFSLSRKLDPCVIFIDEADSILRARDAVEWHLHRSSESISEGVGWHYVQQVSKWILMLATNRPYDLDEAVIRRLPSAS